MFEPGAYIRQIATHYPDTDSIRRVLGFSNADIIQIELEGNPIDNWFQALTEIQNQSKLEHLLQIMHTEYPGLKISPEEVSVLKKFLYKEKRKRKEAKTDSIKYILIGFSVMLLVLVLLLLSGKI